MHIGNLRTALYEYLLARSGGGKFLLRIEDTDVERYVEGATEVIYNTLKVAGIQHDEGPDVGGPFGPYVQSRRRESYAKYAEELVDKGGAYMCFCSKERLDSLKEHDPHAKYDRACLALTTEEARARRDQGEGCVIRQLIPDGETTFRDEIFGDITVAHTELEDQVLLKADGYPTYNFANVVDDHLMQISHVVRGSEYLSSAAKYTLLYHAFGWDVPVYIHLPPVMGSSGKKLSKRLGDSSFEDLLREGFLPEAIVNYIALLGWSPGGEREIYSLGELEEIFGTQGLSKSPSIFDKVKLTWMNSEYFKNMDEQKFFVMAEPYLKDAVKRPGADLRLLAGMCRPRIEFLTDITKLLGFIDELPSYDIALFEHKKMKTTASNALENLRKVLPRLEAVALWDLAGIRAELEDFIKGEGLKNGQVFWPIRTALSGKESSPCGAPELAELLGREESLRRIRHGIELLEQS
ncbi:MAG: glutamate--tRNA ligase [Defluviitaleaceae bacterium]|nr:glutamate--tRNA ligase [Defluviitaleaceae bacterium]